MPHGGACDPSCVGTRSPPLDPSGLATLRWSDRVTCGNAGWLRSGTVAGNGSRRRQAAVAAGDHQTVEAALTVLRAGGNAVDAAVAAGCAAAVAEPGLTSLGGGGFLLCRTPDGTTELLDFFVDTPGRGLPTEDLTPHFTPVTVDFSGAEQVFHAGYGSVAVPGVLPGYLGAHRRLGRLPLADVVAPAATLARRGAVLSPTQTEVLQLLRAILGLTAEAADLFLVGGEPPAAGGRLVNPAYADFLEELGRLDPDGWSDVPEATPTVALMRQHDGLLTADDLDSYRVHEREPHRVQYRGATLTTNPPRRSGGRSSVGRWSRWSASTPLGARQLPTSCMRCTRRPRPRRATRLSPPRARERPTSAWWTPTAWSSR